MPRRNKFFDCLCKKVSVQFEALGCMHSILLQVGWKKASTVFTTCARVVLKCAKIDVYLWKGVMKLCKCGVVLYKGVIGLSKYGMNMYIYGIEV